MIYVTFSCLPVSHSYRKIFAFIAFYIGLLTRLTLVSFIIPRTSYEIHPIDCYVANVAHIHGVWLARYALDCCMLKWGCRFVCVSSGKRKSRVLSSQVRQRCCNLRFYAI